MKFKFILPLLILAVLTVQIMTWADSQEKAALEKGLTLFDTCQYEAAVKALNAPTLANNSTALYYLGFLEIILHHKEPNSNYNEKSLALIKKSANLDNGMAEGYLANHYLELNEPAASKAQGIEWAKQGAHHGDTSAIGALAKAYSEGIGVKEDKSESLYYTLLAGRMIEEKINELKSLPQRTAQQQYDYEMLESMNHFFALWHKVPKEELPTMRARVKAFKVYAPQSDWSRLLLNGIHCAPKLNKH